MISRKAPPSRSALEIEVSLKAAGVNCDAPGFYDDPAFRKIEEQNPEALNLYAEYVDARSINDAEHARELVRSVAEFLHRKLAKDGRLGACVDAAMLLSRFLERLCVWNYMVMGGLTVSFAPSSRRETLYFAPITLNGDQIATGHAWVCAPPFRIVDSAAAFQPYPPAPGRLVRQNFKTPVLEDAPTRAHSLEVRDLLDGHAALHLAQEIGRMPTLGDIERIDGGAF